MIHRFLHQLFITSQSVRSVTVKLNLYFIIVIFLYSFVLLRLFPTATSPQGRRSRAWSAKGRAARRCPRLRRPPRSPRVSAGAPAPASSLTLFPLLVVRPIRDLLASQHTLISSSLSLERHEPPMPLAAPTAWRPRQCRPPSPSTRTSPRSHLMVPPPWTAVTGWWVFGEVFFSR